MTWCLALTSDQTAAPSDAVGGKARSILRLAAAGLAVPPAFVVTDALFRHLRAAGPPLPSALRTAADLDALEQARLALLAAPAPPGFSDEVIQQLARLAPEDAGARFSVRSSFAREDAASGLGAGVYESVVGVRRDQVAAAIRRVLASALAPGAVAYAQAHGQRADAQGPAVLIHRFIDGASSGSAALDPAGAAPPTIDVTTGGLGDRARAEIERALRELAARHGASEVEWVETAAGPVYLQLRRYLAPAPARPWTAAALDDGDWRWDAAHNPLPLSPAQAGLVELVDQRCCIGLRQRVIGGYLFSAPGGRQPLNQIAPEKVPSWMAFTAKDFQRRLWAMGTPPALDPALALFVLVYDRIYGEIQPAARRATRALADFLRDHAGEFGDQPPALATLLAGVASVASERRRLAEGITTAAAGAARDAALARYLERFGDEAPVWDVAVPTFREDPARLQSLVAGPAPAPPPAAPAPDPGARLPPPERAALAALIENARHAHAAGEDDDWLYARAQAEVRRALLAEGARLCQRGLLAVPEDIFWLPLQRVQELAQQPEPPLDTAHALAAAVTEARAAYDRALRDPPTSKAPAGGPLIRGQRGSAGRVVGRAVIHRAAGAGARQIASAPAPDTIVVATTLLPSELPLIAAAGLVVESGGPLGHVAAQARERGIPALVGARGASAAIADGDLLLLDADAGYVVRLG